MEIRNIEKRNEETNYIDIKMNSETRINNIGITCFEHCYRISRYLYKYFPRYSLTFLTFQVFVCQIQK